MDDKQTCPSPTPPYPNTVRELLLGTRKNLDVLLEPGALYVNEVVLALLTTAHDALRYVALTLEHGGELSLETTQRLLSETQSRVKAILGGQPRRDKSAVH